MPLTRRQVYRRRRIAVFGGLAVALGIAFYLPLTLLAPLKAVDAVLDSYAAPVQPAAALSFPGYGASAIGAVGFPGVLGSSGSTGQHPIASITKVVTSLVVLDAKPLAVGEQGPDITFTDLDQQFYDNQLAQNGSVEAVHAGQVISQFNLMQVMLIESANNYAESLASWAFGSEDAYLVAANAWLAKNGLTQTTITDPSGIQPSDTSSAADLLTIGTLAIANPVLAQITSTASTDVPDVGQVKNTNHLLGIDGVDGIKTGTDDLAGACLLFSADYTIGSHTVTVVGVALGGPDHDTLDANVRDLLASVVAGFHEVSLTTKGAEFASYDTPWGDTADAVAATDETVLSWSDTPVSVAVDVDGIHTGKAGADVGTATFTVGEQTVTVDLELDTAITDPGPWWRLTNPTLLF
ncbi:MAG: D-alanyl-D-alanine carboxypeptidase [Rhodoglobus sp.]